MNVGDIFVSIRGDGSKLPADATAAATKAGDTAGKAFSDRFGSAVRTGFKIAATAAGAVLTGATVLATQGQDAMAHFRAETGATQQEAEAAFEAMNRLAGSHLQSFSVVADTLTQVRTQMGLTGDEAEVMASKILDWSTATGQDAVSAVKAFDDASDAWNLTATQTADLMDRLIVSHQKYGGSVEESEGLLNQLAPALQAANVSWEDAVGLINLFNRAGVGAEAAATGFTRVLTKVKSPEELRALVADIAGTSDAFARGQKAADAFGSRAGPKLALALADSGGDLSKFGVSASDAAGAVDKAAQAIEDTLPNKVKLAVNNALSAIRGLGTDFGPALTGSAALISLGSSFASALGLDKAIANALKVGFASAAADGGVKAAVSAAGSAVGGGIGASIVAGVVSILTAPLTIAAIAVAVGGWAVFNVLKDAGQKSADNFVAQTNEITKAAAIGGQTAADYAGKMAVMTAAWGDMAEGAATSYGSIDEAYKAAIESLKGQGYWMAAPGVGIPTDDDIRKIYDGGAAAGLAAQTGFHDHLTDAGGGSWIDYVFGLTGDAEAARDQAARNQGIALVDGIWTSVGDAIRSKIAGAGSYISPIEIYRSLFPIKEAETAGRDAAQHVVTGFSGYDFVRGAVEHANLLAGFRAVGARIPAEIAAGGQERENDLLGFLTTLREILIHGLSPRTTLLRLTGAKAVDDFVRGLNSRKAGAKDAAVALFVATVTAAQDANLHGAAGRKAWREIGQEVDALYAHGMTEETVRETLAGAGLSQAAIDAAIAAADKGARPAGKRHGEQHAKGLRDSKPDNKDAGGDVATAAGGGLKGYDWLGAGTSSGDAFGAGLKTSVAAILANLKTIWDNAGIGVAAGGGGGGSHGHGGPGIGSGGGVPFAPFAPSLGALAATGSIGVHHTFEPLRIETPSLDERSAGALGRGLGSALGLDTIVVGFDRVLTSHG